MPETLETQPPRSIQVADNYPIGRKSQRARLTVGRSIVALLLLMVIGLALREGLRLRAWTWDQTAAIHSFSDINNGIRWGTLASEPAAAPRGFLNVYDVTAATAPARADRTPEYGLDVPPLRLLVLTRWVRWADRMDPARMGRARAAGLHGTFNAWDVTYELLAPLLRLHDAMTMIACLGLFFLTRHWVIRGDRRLGSTCPANRWGGIMRPFRGCIAGTVAMLLFWFNPAVILATHGWPAWDLWAVPFFVWAIYLACLEWWFLAGLLIAVGAMFKGQQLFVAPLFVLWPLLLGNWRASLRWISGLVFGIALIAAPWLMTYIPGGATATTAVGDRHWDGAGLSWAIAVVGCLIAGPVVWREWQRRHEVARPRNLLSVPLYRIVAALLLGVAILLGAALFKGSFAWMQIGWGYGLHHFPVLTPRVSDNLSGLLARRFGWSSLQETVLTIGAHPLRLWPTHHISFAAPVDVSIRALLIALYLLAFLACVVAMAVQSRRNDPNFLIAMTAAWVMFFTLMPQMQERYLLYAAGAGCSLAAAGVGMTLLDVFLSLVTFVMMMHVMLMQARSGGRLTHFATEVSPTFGMSCLQFCTASFPDLGWAVLLAAAIFLYFAFARSDVRSAA